MDWSHLHHNQEVSQNDEPLLVLRIPEWLQGKCFFSFLQDADVLRKQPVVTESAYDFRLLHGLKVQGCLHHHDMLYQLQQKDDRLLSQALYSYNKG